MPLYLPVSCLLLWVTRVLSGLTQSPDCLPSTWSRLTLQAGYAGGHHVKQRARFLLRRSSWKVQPWRCHLGSALGKTGQEQLEDKREEDEHPAPPSAGR